MEDEILLNISTKEPERPKIKIDDVVYELAVPDDFKLKDFLWIAKVGKDVSKLINSNSEKDIGKIEKLVGGIARKVLNQVPDEVYNRLTDAQKFAVINVFTEAVENLGEDPRRPGTKSSPDSSDSMAEASEAG